MKTAFIAIWLFAGGGMQADKWMWFDSYEQCEQHHADIAKSNIKELLLVGGCLEQGFLEKSKFTTIYVSGKDKTTEEPPK